MGEQEFVTEPRLIIQPARTDELETVVDIICQAAVWLKAKGIRQWESPPPPGLLELLEREITKQQVYLAWLEGAEEPIATFRFEWQGGPVWPDEVAAGYLHSLALRPAYIGRRLGDQIIEWAKARILQCGKRWMRLDCIAANERLRRYYERLGFQFRGCGTIGGYVLALYQLDLSEEQGSPASSLEPEA